MDETTMKLLQRTVASLEERSLQAESRINALEQQHVNLEVELGELENIIMNSCESKLRNNVFNWLQRRRDIA